MKVQINGVIHAQQVTRYDHEKDQYLPETKFLVFPYSMTGVSTDYVVVGPHEFSVDVPDGFDVRGGMVENLEREKKKATAEYQRRVTELNAQIQSLLAIENGARS